ncbi:EamA family transporter, partial [Pseudohongiella sp.]
TVLSVFAVFSGFAGIVVILRPVEFNWGALAALGGALALAINAVMVRMLPTQQSTLHRLFLSYLLVLPVAAVLFIWEGLALEPRVVVGAVGSGVLILGYSITVLLAYRDVDANQVTSAEYTGLIWAVAIGWVWFAEVPDLWFVVGSLMIVVPLVWLGLDQRRRALRYRLPE